MESHITSFPINEINWRRAELEATGNEFILDWVRWTTVPQMDRVC